jgi:hypothetical protein
MQTFLPYRDFFKTARVLDYRRLGKQRVEAWQILNILRHPRKKSRWRNHPAVQMWKGYEWTLALYGGIMCIEWMRRGYKDNLYREFELITLREDVPVDAVPSWVDSHAFHIAHRSNLLRKNPRWYRKFWPKLRNDLPYIWPTKVSK